MKKWGGTLMVLALAGLVSAQSAAVKPLTNITQEAGKVKEVGNLRLDGVAEIPGRVVERATQYQNLRVAGFVDWHPSGKGMLISTRFGDASQLHRVSAPGTYRQQLTFAREPIGGAAYAPRTQNPGFIYVMDTGGGEFFQYYWYDEESGRSTLLTDGKSRYQSLSWAPQGNRVAFVSNQRNGKDFDIYVMENLDSLERRTTRLVKETQGEWQLLNWSVDGGRLIARNYISANESYLYVLEVNSGNLTPINPQKKKIAYGAARFAPDGRGIYFTSDEDSEFQRLAYYDLGSKQIRVVNNRLNWDVEDVEIAPDGTLAYTVNAGGASELYLGNVASPENAQRVNLPLGVIGGLKFNLAGTELGFSFNSPVAPADAYSMDVRTKNLTRWTFSEVGGLNPKTFAMPEIIEYPSFDTVNGKPRMIPSFYYKPKEVKKRLPVIINIHGGPEGQSTATFSSTYQYWVNELGAAVLVPNVRGSSGYGKTYLELDNGFKREDSVKDIGKLLDWIATRPELDPQRVAVIGGSYGGYMTLASLTNYSDRLRCGVDVVGISNFVTFLESTQEYRRDLRRPEYGDEREPAMRKFLTEISPLTNANKIRKPLFVVQGKNDPRVPLSEAQQIVKTVRQNNGTVWYLVANDEGHGFRKRVNQDFYFNAVSVFFEQYLLGD
jgi:dipeptidyl aminopeptidase/acylaminoacyl peptidase